MATDEDGTTDETPVIVVDPTGIIGICVVVAANEIPTIPSDTKIAAPVPYLIIFEFIF
jgi:hypothetical protein